MSTLVKTALVAALLAAFVLLVPFGGLTLADRWQASQGAADFGRRTWADMQGVPYPGPRGPDRLAGRGPARGAPPRAQGPGPADDLSAADRQALERLLNEHLGDAPRR